MSLIKGKRLLRDKSHIKDDISLPRYEQAHKSRVSVSPYHFDICSYLRRSKLSRMDVAPWSYKCMRLDGRIFGRGEVKSTFMALLIILILNEG